MANGYDAEGNVAPDPSGGITNDAAAWLAEQNGTVVLARRVADARGLFVRRYRRRERVGHAQRRWQLGEYFGSMCWRAREDVAVSRIEPSHFDSATVYVAYDNHRENDLVPYLCVSNDYGKTFHSIASGLPTERPNYVYVVREDLISIAPCSMWEPSLRSSPLWIVVRTGSGFATTSRLSRSTISRSNPATTN